MATNRINKFGKPTLFRSIERTNSNIGFSSGSLKDTYNSNIASDNSFKYDPFGSAMKSTQQISTDFSKFENHTFFNSAIAKVSVAFNKILKKFPFDGSLYEIEEFEDKLTGYERYVLDNIPKHTGYLTIPGDAYIEVKNIAGNSFPENSSKNSGNKILDPQDDSFSFESFICIHNDTYLNDVGLFYISGSNIKIEAKINKSSNSDNICSASFRIVSGSEDRVINTDPFEKGIFNHISFVLDKEENKIKSFVNSKEQSDSSSIGLGYIGFNGSLFIGKEGTFSDVNIDENYSSFSGSIKDVRIYHQARTETLIKRDFKESIYKNGYLALNFRFNEPTGSYAVKNYVLDTSGNSLHSKIITTSTDSEYFSTIRSNTQYLNPVENENKRRSHILFPDYFSVLSYNEELLKLAEEYDKVNPNIITNLIPPHYFEESLFDTGDPNSNKVFEKTNRGESIPGDIENIKTSILNVLLFSWANIFDEIKLFIDSFGNLIFSDYKDEEIVPDQMILFAAKHLGVELPPIFTNSVAEDFFDTKEIYSTTNSSQLPLKKIQSLIWKRILTDASYFRKTKGTIESLKTIFRSSGIDPDKMFAFIEKGSNTNFLSDEDYEIKNIDIPLINFSGSLASVSEGTLTQYLTSPNKPHFISSDLSVDIQNNSKIYTSGSWTVEGYYCLSQKLEDENKQSLLRLQRYNFNNASAACGILNIVAEKSTHTSLTGSSDSLTAYFVNELEPSSVISEIKLTGINIFDGDLWYVSFSKMREDDILNENTEIGDVYTLRCYKHGVESQKYKKSIFFDNGYETPQEQDSEASFTPPKILIGSQSINFRNGNYGIYHDMSNNLEYESIVHTDFSEKVGSIRFWTKSLTENESVYHARDIQNYGSDDPNSTSYFLNNYEKMIMYIDANQILTSSDSSGTILTDFSQRERYFSNDQKSSLFGFEDSNSFNSFEKFSIMQTSNRIDEINSFNKVRIRSLENSPDLNLGYQNLYPVYDIVNKSDEVNDDARFSIEMSVARIINEKINNEVAGFSFFENILGRKNSEFLSSYNELEYFSNNFFLNVEEDIKIDKLLNVYTWLESSFENIIKNALPKKTKFLGMNFVVESHNLERSKIRFFNENAYMGDLYNNEISEEVNQIQVFTGEISNRF